MPALVHSQTFLFLVLSTFAAGAFGALLFGRNDRRADLWGNGFAIAGSLLGLVFSGAVLITGIGPAFAIPTSFPLLSLSVRVDRLAAFFVLLISCIALFCSIYALGYVNHYYKKYNLGVLGFFYNMFIASMILVVTAGHALFFLIVWEIMSLTSYFLVIYERHEEKNIKAGTLYFIMTHVGTAFIMLSFLLAYLATGSFDFGAIRSGIAAASPFVRNAIFISALIGFGAKAGIIPFHIWLPGAHPAAPSHVSALMSGVMIKTGIYMLARMCWDILPGAPPLWWGLLIVIIGSISSLLGVLYALSEHDLKRLLAYHSIENIGIILLGLGSSLVFLSAGMKAFASLGLIAALYHTLNHATFKALLFLGAGSVIAETHTRNIERYGGLIKVMPQTAFFFLIGSMAISALPPFNGFFSEWVTFQSLFLGVNSFRHGNENGLHRGDRRACVYRRSGGGMLRESVRRHLSGQRAQRRGDACEGGRPAAENRHGGPGPAYPDPRGFFRCGFQRFFRYRRIVIRFSAGGTGFHDLLRLPDRDNRVCVPFPAAPVYGNCRRDRGGCRGIRLSHAETNDHRRPYLGLRRRPDGADGDHRNGIFPVHHHGLQGCAQADGTNGDRVSRRKT